MQCVAVYLHNYLVSHSNRYVSETGPRNFVKSERVYAESVTLRRSSVERTSHLSSRSSVKEKRIQAAKANLTLRLAEEEQCRVIEGELRLDTEKKQRYRKETERLDREQKLED